MITLLRASRNQFGGLAVRQLLGWNVVSRQLISVREAFLSDIRDSARKLTAHLTRFTAGVD